LIPNTPGPKSITISVPFDRVTNPSTRNHLRNLPLLDTLDLSFAVLSPEMTAFLASLPHLTTLTIRVPSITHSLTALPALSNLQKLTIYTLLTPEQIPPVRTLLTEIAPALGEIATVYAGREVVYAPTEEEALELARQAEREPERETGSEKHWERTTNLKMFGGLVGLRMESRG